MKTEQLGNRIYHYCSLKTALEFILPKRQLLLSPIQSTNDPRENRSFRFGHAHTYENDISSRELDNELSEIIREGCKILCFCQDYKNNFGSMLSKMWAQYGDNHRGICLEIDKTEFIKENSSFIDFSLFKNISYLDYDFNNPFIPTIDHTRMNSIGKEKYLKEQFRKEHLDYLFFRKNQEWESEHEIRLLHFSDKPENEYCAIKSSLSRIYLGVNFHNSYLPAIKELIKETDIEIEEIDYTYFGLNFKKLSLLP